MIAIIKETGEIVEVSRIETKRVEGEMKGVHEIFTPNELDLSYIDADWEQRRYELAKAAMQGILSNEDEVHFACSEAEYKENEKHTISNAVAQYAVACADALIKKLKGGKE